MDKQVQDKVIKEEIARVWEDDYPDPAWEYILSPTDMTVAEVAERWQGRGRGYSADRLHMRCRDEGWVKQRKKFQKRLQDAIEKKIIKEVTHHFSSRLRNYYKAMLSVLDRAVRDGVQKKTKAGEYALNFRNLGEACRVTYQTIDTLIRLEQFTQTAEDAGQEITVQIGDDINDEYSAITFGLPPDTAGAGDAPE